jgi:putative ABC transport system substrate-binding protein
MDRRTVILAVGSSLLAMPFASQAQTPAKVWRIGMLDTTSTTLNAANLEAFRQGLRELGYAEGRNLIIEYRSTDGRIERFVDLAVELVGMKVDLIVA